MARRAAEIAGYALLVFWLTYCAIERRVSLALFEGSEDIKDWRRRRHWSVSRREWRLFGKWVVWRTREPLA